MRKSLVLLVAGMLALPHAAAATERPLAASGARAVTRLLSSRVETKAAMKAGAAQRTPPPDTRGWVERHPIWSGTIAGAGVGAAWGALSCREPGDCFPIGAGGAAIVGAAWGAGIGALAGVLVAIARE